MSQALEIQLYNQSISELMNFLFFVGKLNEQAKNKFMLDCTKCYNANHQNDYLLSKVTVVKTSLERCHVRRDLKIKEAEHKHWNEKNLECLVQKGSQYGDKKEPLFFHFLLPLEHM
jgi:hypothetical protein